MEDNTSPIPKTEINPEPNTKGHNTHPFFAKYGSKKWLLPLLVLILILVLAVSAYGVMESSKSGNKDISQTRKEKREEKKQARKENKSEKTNRKIDKKPVAPDEIAWTDFTYTNDKYRINLKYPGHLKANVTTGTSRSNNKITSTVVTFIGPFYSIEVTAEPNTNQLSLLAWHKIFKEVNPAFNTETETVSAAGQQALVQHNSRNNWSGFVPLGKDRVLWIAINYGGRKEEGKQILLEMLESLSITPQ